MALRNDGTQIENSEIEEIELYLNLIDLNSNSNHNNNNRPKTFADYKSEYDQLIALSTLRNLEKISQPKLDIKSKKELAITIFDSWQKEADQGNEMAKLFIIKYELQWNRSDKEEHDKIRNLYAHKGSHSSRRFPRSLNDLKNAAQKIVKKNPSSFSLQLLGEIYLQRDNKMTGKGKTGTVALGTPCVLSLIFSPFAPIVADTFTSYPDRKKAAYCFLISFLISTSDEFKNDNIDLLKKVAAKVGMLNYNNIRNNISSIINCLSNSNNNNNNNNNISNLTQHMNQDQSFISFLENNFSRENRSKIFNAMKQFDENKMNENKAETKNLSNNK